MQLDNAPKPKPYDTTAHTNQNVYKDSDSAVAGGSAAAKSVAGQEEKDIAT